MDFYGLPDWKRIGRDIGKRLKDILNPLPHPGPSKEERRDRRIRDALKGLVYFDDFDELLAWQPSEGDPVQVSNYPLLKRATNQVHDQHHPTTNVILCHDYKGGYHDYESIRPEPLEHEMFSCELLQYVDTFIYFSHKLVCVPPASWTNTLHRNGVRVLGTFVIEPQTSENDRMLSFVDGESTVAKALASMAEYFGFDGWLLNVEKEFSGELHDWPTSMINFISSLRYHLEQQGRILWYDALTLDNKRDYQNALTEKNVRFAKAAGGLFTNYKWTKQKVSSSRGVATENSISSSKIFFGIDVWAQNTNISGHRRTTYPPQGGGGTNTGLVSFDAIVRSVKMTCTGAQNSCGKFYFCSDFWPCLAVRAFSNFLRHKRQQFISFVNCAACKPKHVGGRYSTKRFTM